MWSKDRTWPPAPATPPGAAAINDLIDTIGFYAIIACLVGLLLSALGTWGLLRRTVPAQDAVRLLALADRFCYIRTTPTMMRELIVPAAEESAPGLLAELHAEYAGRQPPDLLAEVRRLAERLPS